jgi:arsenite methyltransferase
MNSKEDIRNVVREKYGEIADKGRETEQSSCGCCGSKDEIDYTVFSEDYTKLKGYNPDADLGLGCGLPTEYALIKKGDTVVDLGSGAGNDCFVARSITGPEGHVVGVDMTENMLRKARENAEKLGYQNVEFRLGEIEHLPVTCNSTDVVISNCVLNLVPNKDEALSETFRILKPGGHFSISDMVLKQELPEGLRNEAAMYAGCVAGALHIDDYLSKIEAAGFTGIKVQKERKIELPESILSRYLDNEELDEYINHNAGIFSITVYAEKPNDAKDCC